MTTNANLGIVHISSVFSMELPETAERAMQSSPNMFGDEIELKYLRNIALPPGCTMYSDLLRGCTGSSEGTTTRK